MSQLRITIRQDAPADELDQLVAAIGKIRGNHYVAVQNQTAWDHERGESVPTGWRHLWLRGTDLSIKKARDLVLQFEEPDQNADHDHARCVASARAMGVPESWAHRPETYLSM
jgi:hypothetical protein